MRRFKMAKSKYEGSKEAIKRYIAEKTDDIRIRVPKGTKEKWKAAVGEHGLSFTAFIKEAVKEKMEK